LGDEEVLTGSIIKVMELWEIPKKGEDVRKTVWKIVTGLRLEMVTGWVEEPQLTVKIAVSV
jgi:hypothetical protein